MYVRTVDTLHTTNYVRLSTVAAVPYQYYASWPKLAEIGSWELFPRRAKVGAKVTHSVGVVTRERRLRDSRTDHGPMALPERGQRNQPRHWREPQQPAPADR